MNVKNFSAAFLSAVIAAANSSVIAPTFTATANGDTAAVAVDTENSRKKDCALRVSVVDGETGEFLDGHNVTVVSNPYGSSYCVDKWNTSEELVKTVSGLGANDAFFIDVQPLSKSHMIYGEQNVTFDHFGQTKDVVLRVLPWKPLYECNVPICIYDWTHCTDNFDTSISFSNEMLDDSASIAIFDENGDFYQSFSLYTGESAIYLPDGKYTMKMYRSKEYHLVSADSEKAKLAKEKFGISVPESDEVEFEVKDGKPDKTLEVYYERYDKERPSNKLKFHAVDSVTGDDIKGISFNFVSDDTRYGYFWNTSEVAVSDIKSVEQGRYTLRAYDIPSMYMQDFTVETEPESALTELYYTAGAAHFMYEADKAADVTLKFKPIDPKKGDCSANISVVDMETGKPVNGAEITLKKSPNASGEKICTWNSSKEPVKHVDKLFKDVYYGVFIDPASLSDVIAVPRYFRFDNHWEEKDIVLRVVDKEKQRNVSMSVDEISNFKQTEDGDVFFESEPYVNGSVVEIFDNKGEFFTSSAFNSKGSFYLPDGEYTAVISPVESECNVISHDWKMAKLMLNKFPDMGIQYKEGIHFKVKNGKCDKDINFFVTKEKNDSGVPEIKGSIKLNVVDGRNFEHLDGVKMHLFTREYDQKTIAELNSTDNKDILVSDLAENTYGLSLDDVPEGYDIGNTLSVMQSTFVIDKEHTSYDTTIVIFPKNMKVKQYLTVHDVTGIEKDQNGKPVYREKYSGVLTPLSEHYDIFFADVEIKGADDGKVYYPRVSTGARIVLPDGDYVATLLDLDDRYLPAAPLCEKISLLISEKGYDKGVCGFTAKFSVKDGVKSGETDFYLYQKSVYESMHRGTCDLNVRVVDVTNEKIVPNYRMLVEYAPERQFEIVDTWSTIDEPEMTVKGLFTSVDYRITPQLISGDYVPLKEKNVKFSDNKETVDVVFRAIPTSRVKKGDSNDDGGVDMADVVMIMQALANPNKYQLTEIGAYNADMDGNGVTVGDAQKIQRILLGLDKS